MEELTKTNHNRLAMEVTIKAMIEEHICIRRSKKKIPGTVKNAT
jgi:hypothetical protein